ncbi:MAG: transpeptidase family protein [Proteobacteria bacterium]|nr:transpeptidase family protein [Pseudomonadota bacterium]
MIWAAVVLRAFQFQVLERDRLAEIAEKESHRVVKLNSVRGDIFDRTGEKLAVSLEADSVFAEPVKIEEPKKTAARLAKVLNLDTASLAEHLAGRSEFAWVKRQISPEEVTRVESLNLQGIHFLSENKRFYPNKDLAAHILGFVGVDPKGLEGLEMAYDEYLRGEADYRRVKRDALGRVFLDQASPDPRDTRGHSVHLTLDRRIQYIAEKALAQAVEKHKARRGMALVVRPQTGEVLASAMVPNYNPNVFARYTAGERRNRILTDAFDPGSTFKIFVVAAALEQRVVEPTTRIFCENGSYMIGRSEINDHHKYGWLTVDKVIQYSSNIGALKIGDLLGPAELHRYLRRFGFGSRTGIDLPAESAGLLRPWKKWRPVDAANVAFGQGVSVTAIQLAMAMSAIANGGLLMRPYIVSKITDSSGRTVKATEPQVIRQAVSVQTARAVRSMLRQVVCEGGTGSRAESAAYPAAGKTGTAQKLDPATRAYSNRKYLGLFVGFVPYNDPQLTILVVIDEPWPDIYGGVVAAPVFREIAMQALAVLNVPPVQQPPSIRTVEPDGRPLIVQAAATVSAHPVRSVQGSAGAEPETTSRYAPGTMPNLQGLSMRRCLDLLAEYELHLNFTGSGRAVWQSPDPGKPIQPEQVCHVRFEH